MRNAVAPVLLVAAIVAAPAGMGAQARADPRDLAAQLLASEALNFADGLTRAVFLAREATLWQVDHLSTPEPAVTAPVAAASAPFDAALLALPPPVRLAAQQAVDAYLRYDAAAQAYPTAGPRIPLPVLEARLALLEASLALQDALADAPHAAVCTPIQIPPYVSVDVTSCDNTYSDNFFLLIDAGGNDTYYNNAGGGCQVGAGAAFDLGGDDSYGDLANLVRCGHNGGGSVGAGFLVDADGRDVYLAGDSGSNGGAHAGFGFLLDAGGDDDAYLAGRSGANGGGDIGSGFLLDDGGNDVYFARGGGTNGGGDLGSGFLYDAWGDDEYDAGASATNGGGLAAGFGFLLDAGGNDTYTAEHRATNGGGDAGTGLLYDGGGTDAYVDANEPTGTGDDRTVVPKGELGAQVDSTSLP